MEDRVLGFQPRSNSIAHSTLQCMKWTAARTTWSGWPQPVFLCQQLLFVNQLLAIVSFHIPGVL